MDVFRQSPFPILYASLPFVRKPDPAVFADSFEDLEMLHNLQEMASGHQCISSMDDVMYINVKFELPDDILQRTGESDEAVRWRLYYWKLYDIEFLANKLLPAEAVTHKEAGISEELLQRLGRRTSCIPILKKLEILDKGLKNGYKLEAKVEEALRLIEAREFAARDIRFAVGSISNRKDYADSRKRRPLAASLRSKILAADHHRCIFCGSDATTSKLEVNHIIPINLIRKLHLDPSLIDAEANLCTTCDACNRGLSDNLTKEDIAFYIEKFAPENHRNHEIMRFLKAIRLAQES